MIKPGEADILISFEKLESLRWIDMVRPDGLVIINNHTVPLLSVSLGKQKYPDDGEIEKIVNQLTGKLLMVKGTASAHKIGDVRTLNIFMLGYMSNFMPFTIQAWNSCLKSHLPSKVLDMNLKAFDLGKKESANAHIR